MQSYLTDYNFGCAHFMRGLIRELIDLNCDIEIFSPTESICYSEALKLGGKSIIQEALKIYPDIPIHYFDTSFVAEESLAQYDAVVINEWIDDDISKKIAEFGQKTKETMTLYYDTHHRILTAYDDLLGAGIQLYDKILVLAESVKIAYAKRNIKHVVVFQESLDEKVFTSLPADRAEDIIWIGNYGHGERGENLVAALLASTSHQCNTVCYGVGYPNDIKNKLIVAGVRFNGWISNIFIKEKAKNGLWFLHIPRAPYDDELAGVPNIRPYEAAGLKIPLIVISKSEIGAPFVAGEHYILFRNIDEYKKNISYLISNRDKLVDMTNKVYNMVLEKHTCRDRALQLLDIIKGNKRYEVR